MPRSDGDGVTTGECEYEIGGGVGAESGGDGGGAALCDGGIGKCECGFVAVVVDGDDSVIGGDEGLKTAAGCCSDGECL